MKKNKVQPFKASQNQLSKTEKSIDEFMLPDLFGQKREDYSNTTDLYDLIPKFYYGKNARVVLQENGQGSHGVLRREFSCNKSTYQVNVSPASILDKNGNTKSCLPTAREELIEEVIKKIIIEKKKAKIEGNIVKAPVSLGEVKQELSKRGHTFGWEEIKEAIEICNKVNIEVVGKKNKMKVLASSAIFPSIYGAEEEAKGENAQYIVSFHTLANDAIIQGKYRLVNYKQLMKYKRSFTRWLHKRIAYLYKQAAITSPYQIKLTTIIQDSGMTEYEKLSNNLRDVEKIFKDMQDCGTIDRYEIEKRFEGRRFVDALCSLWLSESFCSDIKKANHFESSAEEDEEIDLIRSVLRDTPFNFQPKEVENIIGMITNSAAIETVLDAVAYTKQKVEEGGVQNTQAYLKSAIKNKYKLDNQTLFGQDDSQEADFAAEEPGRAFIESESEEFVKFQENLQDRVGQSNFNHWFRAMNLVSSSPLIFEVKSKFIKDWLENNFEEALQQSCLQIFADSNYQLVIR